MLAPHIDATSSRGGAIHQRELAAALRNKNQLTVVFQRGGAGNLSLGSKPQPLLTILTFLKVLPYTKKFDVIHDRGYLLGGAGVLAGVIMNVPTVLQVDDNWLEGDKASGHWIWKLGVYESFARLWIKNFVKRADALAVVSDSLKKVAVNEWGVDPKKVFTVGNGVNLHKFNPQTKPMRKELGLDTDAKVLTFVGEMAPWHGIMEIVKAAELVLEQRDDCVFIFAGGAAAHERYVDGVKRYVQAHGLEKNIRFIGKIPYEKVPSLLASSDILLAPYTQPKKVNFGFSPLKLFEYMAMGKPIITSELPWIREAVSEKEAIILKDPTDRGRFSKAMLHLLEDEKHAKYIAGNSRKLALEKYSWEKVAESMEHVYRTVLR